MEDRIQHQELPFLITSNRSCGGWCPKRLPSTSPQALSPGDEGTHPGGGGFPPLVYGRDAALKRRLRIWKNHLGNLKRFQQYNQKPEG